MYWYYKIPLMILAAVIVIGLCTFVWRLIPAPQKTAPPTADVQVAAPAVLPVSPAPLPVEPAPISEPGKGEITALPTQIQPQTDSQPRLSPGAAAVLEKAKSELSLDNPRQARELAYSILEAPGCREFSSEWMAAADIINEADRIFMNSKAPCPEKKSYTIVPNDALIKIAYRNDTTVGALQRLNGLKSTSAVIHPGKTLQYISGTWEIRVSKSKFLLSLYLDNRLYRIYRISTGKQDRTPAGSFLVTDKIINPAWSPPGQEIIPFGDPGNVLGTRWIALKPVGDTDYTLQGYGIHGTTEPETIGTAASQGCVRMLNQDVEELYDFIPSSFNVTPVNVFIFE